MIDRLHMHSMIWARPVLWPVAAVFEHMHGSVSDCHPWSAATSAVSLPCGGRAEQLQDESSAQRGVDQDLLHTCAIESCARFSECVDCTACATLVSISHQPVAGLREPKVNKEEGLL